MIVDDHPDVVDFLSEQLHEEYTVLTAADGRQALDVIEHNKVDIVLSDIIMPNLGRIVSLPEIEGGGSYQPYIGGAVDIEETLARRFRDWRPGRMLMSRNHST